MPLHNRRAKNKQWFTFRPNSYNTAEISIEPDVNLDHDPENTFLQSEVQCARQDVFS